MQSPRSPACSRIAILGTFGSPTEPLPRPTHARTHHASAAVHNIVDNARKGFVMPGMLREMRTVGDVSLSVASAECPASLQHAGHDEALAGVVDDV